MKRSTKRGRAGALRRAEVLRVVAVLWGIGGAMIAAGLGAWTWPTATAAQEDEERDRRGRRVAQGWFEFSGGRPMLGVQLATALNRELDSIGARVESVQPHSPAAEAGVEDGDVIVSFDGHDLADPLVDATERAFDDDRSFPAQRLIALLEDARAGESVELVVRRDDVDHALTVTPEAWHEWAEWYPGVDAVRLRFGPEYRERLRELGDRVRDSRNWRSTPRAPRLHLPEMSAFNTIFRIGRGRIHGLDLVELNPGLGAYFGTETGVLVADADEDAALGLQAGDVVVGIDGREVEDEEEFRRIVRSYEDGDEIEFRIWRDGAQTTVSGTLGPS